MDAAPEGVAVIPPPRVVAVTGAAGYLGRLVVARLASEPRTIERILAIDVRDPPEGASLVERVALDVRAPALSALLCERRADTVVHLASIVTPPPGMSREEQRSIDVEGTRNVLEAALAAGVRSLVVTTSAAAYGFFPDNPEWLRETCALRGSTRFAYAEHKRLVEALLAEWRERHPEIRQLVLRPGAILGATTANQITALFEKRVVLGVRGAASPFAFVWDEDVVACIAIGVHERREGIFNVAGDGALTLREIAARTGKRYVPLPAGLLRAALALLQRARLTRYGPEQVDFLRWRSALANDRLKREFGYVPRLSARGAFDLYWRERRTRPA